MYNTSFTIVFIIQCAAPSHLTQCTMAATNNQKCTPTRATCGCCHEPSITIRNNGFPRRYTENGSCGLLTYSCFSAPSSSYPPPPPPFDSLFLFPSLCVSFLPSPSSQSKHGCSLRVLIVILLILVLCMLLKMLSILNLLRLNLLRIIYYFP